MPRTARKLAELDAVAARIDHATIEATFGPPRGERLVVTIETSWTVAGEKWYALRVVLNYPRDFEEGTPAGTQDLWKTRGKRFSTVLRAYAKQFPNAEVTPSGFLFTGRGAWLPTATLQRLVLDGLAEALGMPPPVAAPAEAPPGAGRDDWLAVLRTGPDGVKAWNRLKAAQRPALDLTGADCGGLDLTAVKLRGVPAKRATFAGSKLPRAQLAVGCFDWADFSRADLQEALLKDVRAPEAVFRGANLARAVLSGGMFFGATFAGADLTGADLTDTNLLKADFTGAILEGAILVRASFDQRTRWPDGFAIPAEVLFIGPGTDPRLLVAGTNAVADFNSLIARLQGIIDSKRMKRALDMLKEGKNQLFAEVRPAVVRGIVRSQTEEELVYSCVLMEDGSYACCTPDLKPCLGLRGELCKHVLVLLIGLARAGQVDLTAIDRWVLAAAGKAHQWNRVTWGHVSDTLMRYKGVQAGAIDWRPTETIPEDYYAL